MFPNQLTEVVRHVIYSTIAATVILCPVILIQVLAKLLAL